MAPEVIQNSEGYNEKVSIEAVILSFYFFGIFVILVSIEAV